MHTAICAFNDRERAEQARDLLLREGFAREGIHIEHLPVTAEGEMAGTDPAPREAGDRGALASYGHFLLSLLGRDNPSGRVDTYSQHLERGGYVVLVDAESAEQARRARTLLQELQAGDLDVMDRAGQGPLRDLAAARGIQEPGGQAGGRWSPRAEMANERAMVAQRLDAIGGGVLRDPDLDRPPGLRYADQAPDKPKG